MDPSTKAMDSTNPYTVQEMAAIAAIITFLIIFTIFGNVLVIIAVLTSRSLKAPQNLFLVSLAAADILVATLIIPFSLANELMGYWYFGKTWCEIYLALDVLFCTSSIVHLCAISLDRYWSVSQAIEYNSKRTPRRIKCIILIVWTIAASISFPPLIYKGKTLVPPGSKPQCKLNEERWYILSSSIGSFFTPCLIMILVYLRIYHIAKRRTKRNSKNSTSRGVAEGEAHVDVPLHNVKKSPLRVRKSLQEANGHGSSIWCKEQKTMPSTSPSGQKTMADPNGNDGVIRDAEQHMLQSSTPSGQQTTVHPNGKCSLENMGIPAAEIDQSEHHHTGELHVQQGTACTHCPPRALDTIAITGGQVALVRRYREPSPNMAKRKTHMNREKRFTFVLAVVIGVFVLCWFPFFFTYSLGAICPELCQVPNSLFQFFFWIGYCNSSLNPVIYTIFNQDFRRAFRRILCRQWTATAW